MTEKKRLGWMCQNVREFSVTSYENLCCVFLKIAEDQEGTWLAQKV